MSTKQPEALRLADDIKASGQFTNLNTLDAAASELRRLHADNTELRAKLEGFDAADMATAAAQGFRDGQASQAQPAAQALDAMPLPEIKDMQNAPQTLNLNDRAFWVLGWNECRDAVRDAAIAAKQGGANG